MKISGLKSFTAEVDLKARRGPSASINRSDCDTDFTRLSASSTQTVHFSTREVSTFLWNMQRMALSAVYGNSPLISKLIYSIKYTTKNNIMHLSRLIYTQNNNVTSMSLNWLSYFIIQLKSVPGEFHIFFIYVAIKFIFVKITMRSFMQTVSL